ncbi:MAG TPA: hypothetical protein VLD16_06585 [Gaiellaceae bacterium]|nr:hypothetical protein [Gaiellaceae bacterium]
MSATAAPPEGNPTRKVTGLVVWYVVLGAVGWGIVEIAAWMADPCSPQCASVSGSDYADTRDAVLGLGGLIYILACVPLAMLRTRGIVWLVPLVAFLVVTVGGIALLSTAKGGLCDCGFGARAPAETVELGHASVVSPMAVAAGWRILPDRGRKEGE